MSPKQAERRIILGGCPRIVKRVFFADSIARLQNVMLFSFFVIGDLSLSTKLKIREV